MIRLTYRNVLGFIGSAIMTVGSFTVLQSSIAGGNAHRDTVRATPIALHSATMGAWQVAQEDLIVVTAPRA